MLFDRIFINIIISFFSWRDTSSTSNYFAARADKKISNRHSGMIDLPFWRRRRGGGVRRLSENRRIMQLFRFKLGFKPNLTNEISTSHPNYRFRNRYRFLAVIKTALNFNSEFPMGTLHPPVIWLLCLFCIMSLK